MPQIKYSIVYKMKVKKKKKDEFIAWVAKTKKSYLGQEMQIPP